MSMSLAACDSCIYMNTYISTAILLTPQHGNSSSDLVSVATVQV